MQNHRRFFNNLRFKQGYNENRAFYINTAFSSKKHKIAKSSNLKRQKLLGDN